MSRLAPELMRLLLDGAICHEVPTPFAADGSVDQKALAGVVAFQGQHAGALIITTEFGEVLSLSPDERRRVAEISIQAARRTPVIVQVTAFSTAEARDLAVHAEQAGAAAIAAGRPYYWQLSETATIDYFVTIAAAVRCPVLLVSRAEAQTAIAPALLLRSADIQPNLAGVIELGTSCIAPVEIRRLAELKERHFAILLDAQTAAAAAYGGPCAFVSHLGAVAPDLVRTAADAARMRNIGKTREAVARLLGLERVLGRDPARVKYAMTKIGRSLGEPRAPLAAPQPDVRRAIDAALESQGLLAGAFPQHTDIVERDRKQP